MVSRVLLCGLTALFLWPTCPVNAQYIFLDTSNDGAYSVVDRLPSAGTSTVDIWLQTNANRNGSAAIAAARNPVPLSIFDYEFILNVIGGTVEWGRYTNLQPSMDFNFAEYRSKTAFYTGYGGGDPLPPGKYKLGTLAIRVTSGAPRIQFASHDSTWYWVQTSFGSMNPGKNGYNSLMYTEDPTNIGSPLAEVSGDWSDADGISATGSLALRTDGPSPLRFGVSVTPNPLNPDAVITVTTTKPGYLRVRLFDVRGHWVRTLLNEESAPPGTHVVHAGGRKQLASSVYFYEIDASEGKLKGRIVVVK